jgi:DNA invertase Pin-like site-specific DNA recombinase
MIQRERARIRRSRKKGAFIEPRVIAYLRVSTDEQATNGGGLDAQRTALEAEFERRGWANVEWASDAGASGKDLHRPGIERALERLTNDEADILAVAKLDRLSRSLLDFASLMDRATREGWSLIALDMGLDLSTPSGELMAAVLASFAQFERRLIGERTKAGLAAKRNAGTLRGRIGRPLTLERGTRRRVQDLRDSGLTYAAIAEQLNAEGVPTARGGVAWYPGTVRQAILAAAPDL